MQLPLFQDHHEPDADALRRCLVADVVAVDVETETRWPGVGPHIDYGLSYPAPMTVIALAWREGAHLASTALAEPFGQTAADCITEIFKTSALIIAHNAVFDIRQLSKLTGGLLPKRIWDTLAMARLLTPRVDGSYGLLGVAQSLALAFSERQRDVKSQRSKLHLLPLEMRMAYAQEDARLAYAIYERQRDLPQDAALVDWECRAIYEYCAMAVRGIRLNGPYVETYLDALRRKRSALTETLVRDGLKSPRNARARAHYLYGVKGIPLPTWPGQRRFFTWAGRKRLTAHPESPVTYADLSTNARVIDTYLEAGSPYSEALKRLAAFQEVDWLVSTLEGLLEHAILDGRLHSLMTIATDTGRRASSSPHMQNWKMPEMAGAAVGDDGFTLVEIDYRNAENIMAALISSDSALAAACATADFHTAMAEQYFGGAWTGAGPEERKRLRNWSKRITYGTNYGMGAAALGRSLGVSETEARRWMRAKDEAFAEVTRSRSAAQREAQRTHRLTLWTGRVIAVPTAFVAWNYLCQGGVSEAVKRAIVLVAEAYRAAGLRSRVALDMHDALIIEIAHPEWDAALAMARDIMTNITPPSLNERTTPPVRWQAELNVKENARKWGAGQSHPSNDAGSPG